MAQSSRPKRPYDPVARHTRYLRNRSQELAGNTQYRRNHAEEIRIQRAGYRARNKPQIAQKKRADALLHPEKQRARRKRHYTTKRDIELRQNADYRKTHPEVMKACADRRRARKANAPINDFTATDWQEMKAHYGYRCVYCGKKFQRLTQDHIIPLSAGGSHTKSNIVPACRSCNSKKGVGAVLTPVQPLLI
jgi:5-methylcytosine-specific restriction endonuclease McrA